MLSFIISLVIKPIYSTMKIVERVQEPSVVTTCPVERTDHNISLMFIAWFALLFHTYVCYSYYQYSNKKRVTDK